LPHTHLVCAEIAESKDFFAVEKDGWGLASSDWRRGKQTIASRVKRKTFELAQENSRSFCAVFSSADWRFI
jgi:hypothetical protein